MIRIINRTGKFKSKVTSNEKDGLKAMGKFGKKMMDKYVPVDTGYLKSRNSYQLAQNEVYLQNDCEYAIYIEYGTYKMRSQPFMKPAALNHKNEYKRLFAYHLKKGM